MKKLWVSGFLDCFFATRPLLIIPVWGFSIFGFAAAHGTMNFRHWYFYAMSVQVHAFIWMIIFSVSVSSVYLVNQLADREADKKNGGLPLIASGIVSIKAATISAWIIAGVSVVLPLIYCKFSIAALSVVSLSIGIVYSVRPYRLSGRPYFDFLTNAIGFGLIAFGAGWVLGGRSLFEAQFLMHALPYVLLMCAGSISSTLPDIAGDRADGKFTTAVVLGKKNAHALAGFFIIAAALSAGVTRDAASLACSGLALPIYVLYAIIPIQKLEEATYKVGGAVMMLVAALLLPIMIPAALILYFATSSYFQLRHKVKYPSLVAK
jgi:4-hydroxybenzoate polyprenyltransferase